MPKILIKEKDYTTPGLPNSYSNFSVLIAGFCGRTPVLTADLDDPVKNADNKLVADKIQPDFNGVYEFSSAQAFKDTIGLKAPKLVEPGEALITYHYGNQMAYELLNMGYTVIYRPLKPIKDAISKNEYYYKAIQEMQNEDFWEIFKDKASYDFRFITHGLLESAGSDTVLEKRLSEVLDGIRALEVIEDKAKKAAKNPPPNNKFEEKVWQNIYYSGSDYESDYSGDPIEGVRDLRKDDGSLEYNGFLVVSDYERTEDGKTVVVYALDDETEAPYCYFTFEDAQKGLKAEQKELERRLSEYGLSTPVINNINGQIANIAKYVDSETETDTKGIPSRGDCIALIELDERKYNDSTSIYKPEILIIDAINEMSTISADADKGKYCALTVPSVCYKMSVDPDDPNEFGNNTKFPGAFHYLACFMNSLKLGFAEWFAAAGYTRGVCGYTVDYTTVKLGEIAINALEPRNYDDPQEDYPRFACNVIANFRGSYYLWGNRTAHNLGKKGNLKDGDLVASSFLNIRQLCTTIKKQLYVACRRFTFDPNSDTLWVNFCNAIRPTLETMKADQGIRDYKIIKVLTDKKATLKAKIRIIPIEAVEDFDLEVSLEDSFGETTAIVTE